MAATDPHPHTASPATSAGCMIFPTFPARLVEELVHRGRASRQDVVRLKDETGRSMSDFCLVLEGGLSELPTILDSPVLSALGPSAGPPVMEELELIVAEVDILSPAPPPPQKKKLIFGPRFIVAVQPQDADSPRWKASL